MPYSVLKIGQESLRNDSQKGMSCTAIHTFNMHLCLLSGFEPPIYQLLTIAPSMPRLRVLTVVDLNLDQDNGTMVRGALSSPFIKELCLRNCKTYNMRQLGRFVTSFRAVCRVQIIWKSPHSGGLGYNGRIQCHRSSRASLAKLEINLAPWVGMLVEYFITAGPFVAHLESLTLQWDYIQSTPTNYPMHPLRVEELFWHCRKSLVEVTFDLWTNGNSFFPENFSHLGM